MPWFSSDVARLIKRAESTGAKGQPYELPSAAADHHESGNALIEFIVLGTMLMLPTMYFLISVFAPAGFNIAGKFFLPRIFLLFLE